MGPSPRSESIHIREGGFFFSFFFFWLFFGGGGEEELEENIDHFDYTDEGKIQALSGSQEFMLDIIEKT